MHKLIILPPSRTPYFDHFYLRIYREIAGLRPIVAFTHMRNLWQIQESMPYPMQSLYQIEGYQKPGVATMWRDWQTGAAAIKLIRQNQPIAVLIMNYRDPGRWRIIRWCRRHGVPVFVWTDVNAKGMHLPRGWRGWLKQRYLRWINRHVAAWLADGSAGLEYLRFFGVDTGKIFFSPTEPDYAAVATISDEEATRARAMFGLDPSRHRFVCAGRLVPNKRFDLAIDAFARIADERPEWDLVVLGLGELEAALKARVPDQLRERVLFKGFIADPRLFWGVYRNADILVHVADHEPWGLIINEAAACGMAFICTDVVGAAVELVRDGVNGRIVPRGDIGAMAAALRDVSDPQNLDRYKAASLPLLDAWRNKADPVAGFRRAMEFAGVLPAPR